MRVPPVMTLRGTRLLLLAALLPLISLVTPAAVRAACLPLAPRQFPITVDQGGAPLVDYFAVLEIDTATPIGAGHMRADGQDLRFSDAACTELDYWIESGLNTAATRVWVKVPGVPTGASGLAMSYGDPALTHVNEPANVFGPSVAALYTFGEKAGPTVADTVGGHDLTLTGSAAWAVGPRPGVGAVTGLEAQGSRLMAADAGPSLGDGSFTVFAVLNPTISNGMTQGVIGSYRDDGTPGWVLKLQGQPGQFMMLTNGGNNWCQVSAGNVQPQTWSMIGGRRVTGVENALFQDGQNLGEICAGDARNVDGPGAFDLGRAYDGNYPLQGTMSFSVVYTQALDDVTIAALYASLLPPVHPTLTIGMESVVPTITSPAQAAFTVGAPGTFTITSTGEPPPTVTLEGALPDGVTYDAASATLNGTPEPGTAGAYSLVVSAQNGIASAATQDFTLLVEEPPPPPVEPRIDAHVAVDGALVTLSWSPIDGAELYLIEVGDAPGRTNYITRLTPRTQETGLLPAGEYYLRVRRVSADGLGVPSDDVRAVVNTPLPVAGPPIAVGATVTGTTVQLTWRPSIIGVAPEAYLLELGTERFAKDLGVVQLPGTTTTLTVPNVPPGTYAVRLRAMTSAGITPESDDVLVHVGGPGTCAAPPVAPVLLTPVVSDHTATLTWLAPVGDTSSFHLQAGTAPGLADLLSAPVGPVTGLGATAGDGRYAVRIVAENACGTGPASADTIVTIGGDTPGAPTNLAVTKNADGLTFSWAPPVGGPVATHYLLEAGTSPDTVLAKLPVTGATSLTVTGVPPGRYLVRVVSVNASGFGTPSDPIVVEVP